MTATTETVATNPDGTCTSGFLAWEAQIAFRVAARVVLASFRALRVSLGAGPDGHITAVIGAATVRAETDPVVAERLEAWKAAGQAFMDSAWARAEVDPTFDILPFIANSR